MMIRSFAVVLGVVAVVNAHAKSMIYAAQYCTRAFVAAFVVTLMFFLYLWYTYRWRCNCSRFGIISCTLICQKCMYNYMCVYLMWILHRGVYPPWTHYALTQPPMSNPLPTSNPFVRQTESSRVHPPLFPTRMNLPLLLKCYLYSSFLLLFSRPSSR